MHLVCVKKGQKYIILIDNLMSENIMGFHWFIPEFEVQMSSALPKSGSIHVFMMLLRNKEACYTTIRIRSRPWI